MGHQLGDLGVAQAAGLGVWGLDFTSLRGPYSTDGPSRIFEDGRRKDCGVLCHFLRARYLLQRLGLWGQCLGYSLVSVTPVQA